MTEIDERKLVLLDTFCHKIKTFKKALKGIDDIQVILAIVFEVFYFIEALERLEGEQSKNLLGNEI